ncbi:MAG: DedA family protein [Acidobacteriaceae bacterium]|nr:DedA family protein [Acidobacteriaceae bacterium]MBV8571575.1 DedA family protein [Acidobacteriaceae bacterium]
MLAVFDSAGLPIVGGVDALLIAFSSTHPQRAYIAAAGAVVGSLAGSLVLFYIARKGGEVLLARHTGSRLGARLHRWFYRYGLVTVFIPALSPIPLPMKVPVFCAGALRVRVGYFATVVVAARMIRYFALAYFGAKYGQETFTYITSHGKLFGVIAAVLALAAAIGIRLAQKLQARSYTVTR